MQSTSVRQANESALRAELDQSEQERSFIDENLALKVKFVHIVHAFFIQLLAAAVYCLLCSVGVGRRTNGRAFCEWKITKIWSKQIICWESNNEIIKDCDDIAKRGDRLRAGQKRLEDTALRDCEDE